MSDKLKPEDLTEEELKILAALRDPEKGPKLYELMKEDAAHPTLA